MPRHFNHFQRVTTAAFMWINGLNPDVFYDWCDLRNHMRRGSPEQRHFVQLFGYFDEGRRYTLWSWNVSHARYEYLDGSVRIRPISSPSIIQQLNLQFTPGSLQSPLFIKHNESPQASCMHVGHTCTQLNSFNTCVHNQSSAYRTI